MKTLSRFAAKFTSLIVAVLSCFDRVIFKGHLPISNGPALEGFDDHVLKAPSPPSPGRRRRPPENGMQRAEGRPHRSSRPRARPFGDLPHGVACGP